ncbi:ribosomal L1 domain-containing protein 1-like [Haliotis rubra]|uniref:ribosomal L1 domain-containing protein 1-like n=1 Tax=Haliotis rubra TaxID=36100 RepID=UPI001EE4EC4E|nr:ribosomal L1 domain-containing protein 1-like [Haliotis rubra]
MELEKAKVRKAVAALSSLLKNNKKSNFIDEAEKIHLQFTFKKVPNVKNKTLHLKLPHSLKRDTLDVCLFVKDLNKKKRDFDPAIHHYKELVVSTSFSRLPIGVNMGASDLKKELQQALDKSHCYISGRGPSCMSTVAHSEMKAKHVVDNVITAANQIATGIPGGPINIKSMYIKTEGSMSVPLFVSTDDVEVVLPRKERKVEDNEPEEITTILGSKVKVSRFGDVKVIQGKRVAEDEDLDLDSLTEKKKIKSAQAKTSKKSSVAPTKSKSVALKQKTLKSGIKQPKKSKKQKTKS